MSMLCSLHRVGPQQVERLLQTPGAIGQLLGHTAAPAPKAGLLAKLFGRAAAPQADPPVFEPIAASDSFELDGAWHILHFLFSGLADDGVGPAAFLLSGGQDIGPDRGYGPARLLDAAEVDAVMAFLEGQSHAALRMAYDPAAIDAAEVYWQASRVPAGRQQQLDDLWDLTVRLRGFVKGAADSGARLVIDIY